MYKSLIRAQFCVAATGLSCLSSICPASNKEQAIATLGQYWHVEQG